MALCVDDSWGSKGNNRWAQQKRGFWSSDTPSSWYVGTLGAESLREVLLFCTLLKLALILYYHVSHLLFYLRCHLEVKKTYLEEKRHAFVPYPWLKSLHSLKVSKKHHDFVELSAFWITVNNSLIMLLLDVVSALLSIERVGLMSEYWNKVIVISIIIIIIILRILCVYQWRRRKVIVIWFFFFFFEK